MPSICFVSFYSGTILFPDSGRNFGGAEVQQGLLAETLSENNFDVKFVIGDEPETRGRTQDKYPVYKTYDRNSGIRFLKLIYPQFVSIWKALKQADCDYYYVRGMRLESGIAWMFCRFHGRKYISAIASDRECNTSTLPLSRWSPRRLMFIHALKNADRVFAQSVWQQEELTKAFGVDSTVVRNIMPIDAHERSSGKAIREVLWVGTIVPSKRPEILLSLATVFGDINFTMIGPSRLGEETYRSRIQEQASKLHNLRFIDHVSPERMFEYYRQSDLFILTSSFEGFPNVLLQAFAAGVPVITSCDPDGVVERFGLGRVAKDENDFTESLEELVTEVSAADLREMDKGGRSYVEEFHSPEKIGKLLRQILVSC